MEQGNKLTIRDRIRRVVDDNTTPWGKAFDYFIQALILLSLIDYSLDTLPDKSSQLQTLLDTTELVTVAIFSVEYLLRVFIAKNPLKYMFSFFGLIDLLAILPFYLNTTLDLRSLRAFRVFRVFRALKLIRYNSALNRFTVAARIVKEEIVLFLIVTAIILFLSSAGIYYFENPEQPEVFSSLFASAWWSIVTLTTVGYGDVFPITLGGKIFTFFILMLGVGIITVPAGLIASALTTARKLEAEEAESAEAAADSSNEPD